MGHSTRGLPFGEHPNPGVSTCNAPEAEWKVVVYRFFGHDQDASLVTCKRCGWFWATKAAYVERLKREGLWAE